MVLSIDVNCDMGEIPDSHDEALMDYVSSVSIACGFHAGNSTTMRQTAKLALKKELAIGAHPSFFDREGFGRRNMNLSPEEIFAITTTQIKALKSIVESEGGKLAHVKPHGALYNMAAKDAALAEAIAKAIQRVDPHLIFYGLAGSELIRAGERCGLKVAQEIFADRTYQADGSLTPRTESNAFVTDAQVAATKVAQILKDKKILADTVCVHGDGSHALAFARDLHKHLKQQNILIKKIS